MNAKEKKPRVSVVIATYNRLKFVQEAIDSVLNQTYNDYELFVIDDGSTDETKMVIPEKYKGKLTYIWQKNRGESAARNLGISMASGEYLAFLDSDDLWHPEKLAVLVQEFDQRRQEENDIALICSSVWLIDSEGQLIQSKPAGRSTKLENLEFEDFFYRPRIYSPPSNAIFVKKFVEDVGGFDEDIRYGEDWALLLKLRNKYKFGYFDKPLTYFRIHNINQQSNSKLEEIDQYLTDHLKVVERLSYLLDNPVEANKIRAHFFEQTTYWYFSCNSWEAGLRNLQKAVSLASDSILDESRVIQNISIAGLENAKFNMIDSVSNIINHFTTEYFPMISSLWPTELLFKKGVMRKSTATFCHILMCDRTIKKSRKELLKLSFCTLKYVRYWRSLTTWKTITFTLLNI